MKVSVATVRKFCRKHHDEADRLRAKIEDGVTDSTAPIVATPVKEQRPPLTNDPGKRGPRPARDQL
jgi:hypothetical protein